MPTSQQRRTETKHEARSRGYHANFTYEQTPATYDAVIGQYRAWLSSRKSWETDLADGYHVDSSRELLVMRQELNNVRVLRTRLVERTLIGTWRTELTLHHSASSGWITIDVTNDRGRFAAVPELSRRVMDVVEVHDGPGILSVEPSVFGMGRLPELQDILCDPDRQGLVFVAGTDHELDFQQFRNQLQRWTAQVQGLAAVVLLDPHATSQLANDIGERHAALPWTVRTYLPEVDPAVSVDARRHRILGTKRLASMPDPAIVGLLGGLARSRAAERALTADQIRVFHSLEHEEDRLLLTNLTTPARAINTASPTREPGTMPRAPLRVETPPPSGTVDVSELPATPSIPTALADLARLRMAFGVDEFGEASIAELAQLITRGRVSISESERISRELSERRSIIDELRGEVGELRGRADDVELEAAETQEQAQKLAEEVRYLRGQLRANEQWDVANSPVPAEAYSNYPSDFSELLERLPGLQTRGVVFSGDPDHPLALDAYDAVGRIVRNTWEVLLVLADYITAKAAGQCVNVHDYLQSTPAGLRGFPSTKHAQTESDSTINAYGHERVFPVPATVHKDEELHMYAHFKLAKLGMVSPRLYYLDDVTRSRNVYVGYVGRHLTTMGTN